MSITRPSVLGIGSNNIPRSISRSRSIPPAALSNTAAGSYTDSDGQRWLYYQWTTSGSASVTVAGMADVLLVGGGSAYDNTAAYGSSAGKWISGTYFFSASTYTVTVATGGLGRNDGWVTAANSALQGPATSLGTLTTLTTGLSLAGSQGIVTSSITGTSLTYPNSTYGAMATVSTTSGPGVAYMAVRI